MKKLLAYFSGDAALLARLGTVELLLGDLEEADRRFKTSLDIDSNQPSIQFMRGTALQELGRNLDALRCYNQAISLRPGFDEALLCREQLVQRLNGKAPRSAMKSSRSRKQGSNDAESNYEKGLGSFEAGKLDKALANFDRAIAMKPGYAEAYCGRGVVLKKLNRPKESLASLDRAIALSPGLAEAHCGRGAVLKELNRLDEALASLDRAVALSPDLAEPHNNRGVVLKELNRLDEALASLDRAIALKPDHAAAHCARGVVLKELSQLEEALASLDRATAISPGLVEAHNNRGVILEALGRPNEALAGFDDAISLSPGLAPAHKNRGSILADLFRLDEALESVDRAIELDPSDADSHINRGYVLEHLNRLDEAMASCNHAIALKPDSVTAYNNLLFMLSFYSKSSPADYLDLARRFDSIVTERAEAYTQWRVGAEGGNDKRLRVALVSGDFKSHSVGFFLESVVAHLDSNRIELVAYATSAEDDMLTARIKPRFAAWNTLVGLSDESAAKAIHSDGIHILIDLAGHTAFNRLPVFAWKPAPVQASWLGFCATTGVSAIDYYIADSLTLPPSLESQFTETVWRLPETYLCLSRPEMDVAVAELPALTAGHVTFGSFNNSYKMTEEVIALWARILKAVPGSRLFLKTRQFKEGSVRERMLAQYAAHGISSDRLQFEGHIPDRGAHLTAYNQIDIGLDPFPYNGVTSTVEGLWMGVPVLTLAGERFLSRQGVGILTNAGLRDWIARDADELVAKAVAFAGDLDRLTALRAGLRQQVLISPLFDAARFARHFEDACFGMWHEKMADGMSSHCHRQSRQA